MAWECSEEIWLFVESNLVGAVLLWVRVDVDGIAIFISVPRIFQPHMSRLIAAVALVLLRLKMKSPRYTSS